MLRILLDCTRNLDMNPSHEPVLVKYEPDQIAQYMREVAEDKIIPRFQNLKDHEINTKTGPSDLVTIADREAEEDLTKLLKDIIPGAYVIGEEAISEGTAVVETLANETAPVWVIDPVDGTNNFSHGKPTFGMIICLCQKGEIIAGWIYDIPGGRMAISEKGAGLTINDTQTKLPPAKTDLADLKAYLSIKFVPANLREIVSDRASIFAEHSSLLCCAHEYLNMLEGQRDFSFYRRTKIWDHGAGILMMHEAGGFCRNWKGELYNITDDQGGLISAPNEALWHEIRDRLLSGI